MRIQMLIKIVGGIHLKIVEVPGLSEDLIGLCFCLDLLSSGLELSVMDSRVI